MSIRSLVTRAAGHVERLTALRSFDRGVVAPPAQRSKRRHLLRLFRERGHQVLIESGTFRGETVRFFLPHASRIVSIEVDPSLHAQAAARFADKPQVEILLGDALKELPRIAGELEEPAMLWLDGHYSGGETGRGEVDEPGVLILDQLGKLGLPKGTTVVVDDVRAFGVLPDFPSLETFVDAARAAFPGAKLTIELDSLVIRA